MEEKDLSQNPHIESQSEENVASAEQPQAKESRKDKMLKAVVKDMVEFRQFDMIHKLYFLMLSREALAKLSLYLSPNSNYRTEFKPFIDNYIKSTYNIICNYFRKQNLANIIQDIDKVVKTFFISGQVASQMYSEDVLFSQRSYESLKLYLITNFILPLLKKTDSKLLYNDLKTLHINSKNKEISSDYNKKLVAAITNLTNASVNISYSAYALKKSMFTFNDFYDIDLEIDYDTLATEQILTIPFNEDYDGDRNQEKMNKVYVKVDKEYQAYYKEKIHQLVEEFLKEEISAGKAMYFYVTVEFYLAFATHLIKHDNAEVGIYLVMTIADQCSRLFAQYIKPEDFVRFNSLKNICSTTINKTLTVLYAVGNLVDQHQVKHIFETLVMEYAVPSEHRMGSTDINVYLRAWNTLAKQGKEKLEAFLSLKKIDKKG